MSLTRGGAGLIGLVVFVLILSTPNNATIFIVLSCFVALMILNIPYALASVRGLEIHRDHPTHVKEGSEMRINLRVINRARTARILLRFLDRGPWFKKDESLQIPLLAAGAHDTISYTCRAGRRGVYKFESCGVESSSPFGLVNARVSVPAESNLVVYPVYYELRGAALPFRKSFSGQTAAPGSRPGEGASFFGLREYRSGDPIRKIHWASSVRTRSLMVKEFEEDLHSSVVLMLDTDRRSILSNNKDTNLELAIRVAASLANHTLVNGHPTTLMYFDEATKTMRTDKAMGDLTPVLDGLARLGASSMNACDFLVSARNSVPRHSNMMAILLSPDQSAMEELLKIRAQGLEVMLVLVGKSGKQAVEAGPKWLGRMLEMYEIAGINTIMISFEDDIQAALSRDMRASRRLRL